MQKIVITDVIDQCTRNIAEAVAALPSLQCNDELMAALARSLDRFLRTELRSTQRTRALDGPRTWGIPAGVLTGAATQGQLESFAHLRASQWQESVIELLQRVARDWTLLVDRFGIARDATLTAVSEPLGDPHGGGRSVCTVTFSDGLTIVYKPRSVEPERVFGIFVGWLNDAGCTPVLTACPVLPRGEYGWTSYVRSVPCLTHDEAEFYYRRQGAFLAVFHFLHAGDCIHDNVVVNGAHPVWIDTECLCAPLVPLASASSHLPSWLTESILTTSMVFYPNDMDVPPRETTGLHVCCLADRSEIFSDENVLKPRYLEAVVGGFHDAYAWVLRNKAYWLSSDSPLMWWQDRQVRVVLRPTRLYDALARVLLTTPIPERATVRILIESLLRTSGGMSWLETIVRAELVALERGDVPYWTTSTNSRNLLEAAGGEADAIATQTGMERVLSRAARMDDEDLRCQMWLIRSFLSLPVPKIPVAS